MNATTDQRREAVRAAQRTVLVNSLEQGATRSAACRAAGVPRRTFYAWLDQDQTFREDVEEAEYTAVQAVEGMAYACAMHAAADPRYFRFLAFFLERKAGWNKPEVPAVPASLGTAEADPARAGETPPHASAEPAPAASEPAGPPHEQTPSSDTPDAPQKAAESVQVVQVSEACTAHQGAPATTPPPSASPVRPDRTQKPLQRTKNGQAPPRPAPTAT